MHLRGINSAIDTGIAVDPDTIVAQLQGGLIFGLTAALYGEVTIEKGPRPAVQLPRLPHAAHRSRHRPIEVHIIKSGEPPAASAKPARRRYRRRLRNAIFAATGVPCARLPIDRAPDCRGEENIEPCGASPFPSCRRYRVVALGVFDVAHPSGPGPLAFAAGPESRAHRLSRGQSDRRSGRTRRSDIVKRGDISPRPPTAWSVTPQGR